MKVILFFEKKFQWIVLLLVTTSRVLLAIVKNLQEFLTVYRKYRYHFIYVFHIIMPENQIWKKILSQTNIFNVFPLSVSYNTIAKILQSNCRQTTKKYVPAHSMCLNRILGGGREGGVGLVMPELKIPKHRRFFPKILFYHKIFCQIPILKHFFIFYCKFT